MARSARKPPAADLQDRIEPDPVEPDVIPPDVIRQGPVRQATNVLALIDVVGALGSGALAGNLFLFDNNRWAGSTGHGSAILSTVAQQGDVVVWTTTSLECEAFARLQLVEIDIAYADYVDLDAATFGETPEIYWFATILQPLPPDGVPYRLSYRLGSADAPYRAAVESRLIPPLDAPVLPPVVPDEQTLDTNEGDVP